MKTNLKHPLTGDVYFLDKVTGRTRATMNTKEQITFRLILTPCCHHLLCWINPRLPTHCPECGQYILSKLRPDTHGSILHTSEAWLSLKDTPKEV